jgi:serine/threonine-protein kinase
MSGPGSRIGAVINGKWHVDRLLGQGGMAEVYAATHRNGKRAALKILHRELASKPATLRRFRREGYAANRVEHPAVVTVDDDDVCEDGAPYLVMELLEGHTLEELRSVHGGRLPAAQVVSFGAELMAVMAVAHRKGVVHRDIKPSNLLVTADGTLKVLDFGIARVSDGHDLGDSTAECCLGTPSYMSPEQARGRWDMVDARSDIYAIGATLFTLLSGRAVHQAATRNEQLGLAMTAQAPLLGGLVPELPDSLARVVDGALRYDRERRWTSVESMRRAWLRAAGRDDAEAASGDEPDAPSLLVQGDAVAVHALPTVITEHSVSLSQPSAAPRRMPLLRWAAACAVPLFVLAAYAGARYAAVSPVGALKPGCGVLRSSLAAALHAARPAEPPRPPEPRVAPVASAVTRAARQRVRPPRRAAVNAVAATIAPIPAEPAARSDSLATQLDRRR